MTTSAKSFSMQPDFDNIKLFAVYLLFLRLLRTPEQSCHSFINAV